MLNHPWDEHKVLFLVFFFDRHSIPSVSNGFFIPLSLIGHGRPKALLDVHDSDEVQKHLDAEGSRYLVSFIRCNRK